MNLYYALYKEVMSIITSEYTSSDIESVLVTKYKISLSNLVQRIYMCILLEHSFNVESIIMYKYLYFQVYILS